MTTRFVKCRKCGKWIMSDQGFRVVNNDEAEHIDCDNPQSRQIKGRESVPLTSSKY